MGHRRGRLGALLWIQALNHCGHLRWIQASEADLLTAGANGGEQTIGRRRQQDQQPMTRLFQGFEQRIRRCFRHRLGVFDDHQAAGRLQRLTRQKPTDLPDLIQTHLRWGALAHTRLVCL